MAPSTRPTPRTRPSDVDRPAAQRKRPTFSPGVLPLVVICSVLLSAGMAFGNPLIWRTFEEQAADAPAANQASDGADDAPGSDASDRPNENERSSYTAVSTTDEAARNDNLRLCAEAIDGATIQPGEEFSFNNVVGDITSQDGYQEDSTASSGDVTQDDSGSVGQVATALYIAAVQADLEIVERHAHSVPANYAPIGLDATIVYGTFDLCIKNNTSSTLTIHAKAEGPSVEVSLAGDSLPDGLTVEATSQVVQQYHRADVSSGQDQQYYVTESFKVYRQDGERSTRDLLSRDVYLVEDEEAVVFADGGDKPSN